MNVYALLDGASVPNLPAALGEHGPEHVCLYRGELQPDVAEVAPYLVALQPDHAFTGWVLREGWGRHWGIFAAAPAEVTFRDVRRQCRQFLLVRDAGGKLLYFRYYDPRVLQAYAPTCNAEELRVLFGPLSWYAAETDGGAGLVKLALADEELEVRRFKIGAAAVEV